MHSVGVGGEQDHLAESRNLLASSSVSFSESFALFLETFDVDFLSLSTVAKNIQRVRLSRGNGLSLGLDWLFYWNLARLWASSGLRNGPLWFTLRGQLVLWRGLLKGHPAPLHRSESGGIREVVWLLSQDNWRFSWGNGETQSVMRFLYKPEDPMILTSRTYV